MILIVCDHKKRELKIQKKLVSILKKNNLKSIIINKNLILKAYNFYKPKIIIFPHANSYISEIIKKLGNKVIKILLPTEHCAFNDKFIDTQYQGTYENNKNSFELMDAIFCQSDHIKSKLTENNKFDPKKIFVIGHAYYSEWKYEKKENKNIKNIGIALTNEFIMRRFYSKNIMKDFFNLSQSVNLLKNDWRFEQLSFDLFYFTLIFELIKKLKNYNVNIRTHTVDVESNFKFLENRNIKIDRNSDLSNWLPKQDLVISSISFIHVDTYIAKKPHISLINLIPEKFFFSAYNSYTYKEFKEPNSFKPKNIDELIQMIPNIQFNENDEMDLLLKKYFSFPYHNNPLELIAQNLKKVILTKNNDKFEPILSSWDKILIKIFGKKISFFITMITSQLKLLRSIHTKNSYFDFLFFLK